MSSKYDKEVLQLDRVVSKFCQSSGGALAREVEVASTLLLTWLGHIRPTLCTGIADELIAGTHSALLEATSCICLGLARPAIFSIRAQVDMCLAWIYFRDHRVEWSYVQEKGEGFKLKKEIYAYLDDYYPKFRNRFSILSNSRNRQEEDPYRLLSAHVHSQSIHTMPNIIRLDLVVNDIGKSRQCINMELEVSEYLNDIFVSCFGGDWAALPDPIMSNIRTRLKAGALRELTK